jgi:hypothetical protein
MNTPDSKGALPTAAQTGLAELVLASAMPPAPMVPLQSDYAIGVRPVMPISLLTYAVTPNTAPLATSVLPIAACGDDELMSQPQ